MAEGLDSYSHVSDLTKEYLQHTPAMGIPTGFKDIDGWLDGGGLVRQRIYVIAGRTGEGKSSLAISLAKRISIDGDASVLFLSLEMPKMEIMQRLACQLTLLPVKTLEARRAKGTLLATFAPLLPLLATRKLHIEDSKGAHPDEIEAMLLDMKEKRADVVIIDHLQRVHIDYGATRREGLDHYLNLLSLMAKKCNVAVLLCCQINREGTEAPKLIHLKETGAIEEIADVVMICNKKNYEVTGLPTSEEPDCEYEIWVAKHRQGPEYKFNLMFRSACFEFLNPRPYTEPQLTEVVVVDDPQP